MAHRRTRWIVGGVVALVLVGGGSGVALAGWGGGDDDVPITGPALDDASAAALAHTGGGTVTDTEVGDEEGFYEVEVTLDDGEQVDVHLDEDFDVLGAEADADGAEGADDGAEADDD